MSFLLKSINIIGKDFHWQNQIVTKLILHVTLVALRHHFTLEKTERQTEWARRVKK